jgi:hypothetical protein
VVTVKISQIDKNEMRKGCLGSPRALNSVSAEYAQAEGLETYSGDDEERHAVDMDSSVGAVSTARLTTLTPLTSPEYVFSAIPQSEVAANIEI